jgi:hypothetical protein
LLLLIAAEPLLGVGVLLLAGTTATLARRH